MKGLLELQQSAGNSLEFIENVKIDLFPDEVYIFSPMGEIYELPQGSTPIDFAYAVHTDIGSSCVACRIDRRLAPLSAQLESGQTVEIIRANGARPNPDWLSFAVTGKARSGIRSALKAQQDNESLMLGRRLIERALSNLNFHFDQVTQAAIDRVLEKAKLTHLDDLLAEVGLGNQMPNVVARRLIEDQASAAALSESDQPSPLSIKGTEGLVVTYARCCRPIPGDPITGHISAGRGIVVHLESCKNLIELQGKNEEIMTVRWETNLTQEFAVELRIELEHEPGLIAVLASTITTADANIERISILERDAHLATVNLVVNVQNRVHLARAIRKLRHIHNINKIVRVRS
jgi:(p)ppGpp synthase/HD superfamily hydrolase